MRLKTKSLFTVVLLTIITFTLVSCTQNVSFTVYFNSNGGSEVNSITTDGKSTVTVPTNPEKVGYTFEGWYWDNETFQTAFSANSLLDAPLSSDMTVYAKWDPITYTISYVLNGGINNPSNLTTFNIETTNLVINNPTKEGYTFVGWFMGEEKWSFIRYSVTEDITLVAKWIEDIDFNIEGATLESNVYHLSVDNNVTSIDFKQIVQSNQIWYLSKDINGTSINITKVGLLEIGNNTFYIIEEDGNDYNTYEINIRRLPMYEYFHNR